VHHCAFCGWWRSAASATILDPACERCGCTLRADTTEEFDRLTRPRRRPRFSERAANADVSGVFALVAAAPFVLPVVGVQLGDVVFALPLVLLIYALAAVARARSANAGRRAMWTWLVAGVALAGTASAVGLIGAIAGGGDTVAFYLGSTASVAMLVALASFAVVSLRSARTAPLIDAAIVAISGVTLAAVFVIVPGFARGDALLTLVALIDVVALLFVTFGAVARRGRPDRRVTLPLVGATAAATVGDCLVSATAAGQIGMPAGATAALWAVAGYLFAIAAEAERNGHSAEPEAPVVAEPRLRWIYVRTLLPLGLVLGLQAVAIVLWLIGELETWEGVMFGAVLVVQIALAFGRQAHLLVDNRRAIARERAARREAMRRNEELEALTGLATTMTQTLEEAPIAEQALSVLHLAARATSSALHARDDHGRYELRAAAGDWQTEKAWPGTPSDTSPRVDARGGRAIVRLTVAARGNRIGTVTLVRRASDPFAERELELLGRPTAGSE
jgi:hypothetical protein